MGIKREIEGTEVHCDGCGKKMMQSTRKADFIDVDRGVQGAKGQVLLTSRGIMVYCEECKESAATAEI